MKIEIIKCLQDNYSYLIIDKKSNEACVVDPRPCLGTRQPSQARRERAVS